MSSAQSDASKQALNVNEALANRYYGVALPALSERMGAINQSLAQGEAPYLQQAYGAQRTGLTEGLAAQGGAMEAQKMAGSKKALSGGNAFASLHPADIGAQLANALYGSKFQEGQANMNQGFNLISMGLGGAGTTGNAALNASGQELNAIRMLPGYNQTYANIAGGAAGLASTYGALNQAYPQLFGPAGTTNTGATLPMGWSSSGVAP
jgi:hypothetical protein